jgi:hypothetical protein
MVSIGAPMTDEQATFTIQTVCECQALLHAELDAKKQVLGAWISYGGERENAAANAVGAPAERFDVSWACPRCGRNTLRTFYEGALRRVAPPAAPPPAPRGGA